MRGAKGSPSPTPLHLAADPHSPRPSRSPDTANSRPSAAPAGPSSWPKCERPHRVPGERVPGERPGAAAGAGRGEGAASAGGGGRRPLTRRSVRGHRGPPRRPLRPPPAPRSKSGSRTSGGSAPARPWARPVPGPRPALLLKGPSRSDLTRYVKASRAAFAFRGSQPRPAEEGGGICPASIPCFPYGPCPPTLRGLARLKASGFLLPVLGRNVPMMLKRYSVCLKEGSCEGQNCKVRAQRPGDETQWAGLRRGIWGLCWWWP